MEEDPQVSCSMNFISKLAIYKRNEFATKKAQVCIYIGLISFTVPLFYYLYTSPVTSLSFPPLHLAFLYIIPSI